jgi:hypothetical protein
MGGVRYSHGRILPISPLAAGLNQASPGSIVRGSVPRRLVAVASLLLLSAALAGALSADLDRALRESQYVYVQSERRGGVFGRPAEIWFMYDGGAVLVGTPPTSWRVKRIRAGRPRARIAVGKPDGPSFDAKGEIVRDPAVEGRLMDELARKYPDGWKRFEQRFREGFKTGERVVVRYTPTAAAPR